MPRATRIPAYCSAMGKAVLPSHPAKRWKPMRRTDAVHPVHGKDHLRSRYVLKELEAIRERGYAVMNEEMAAHLVGVAAPVFNKEGYPRYAVSVAGLCFRPVEAFVAEVCDDVVQTAREISEFLAHARTMEDK